jgi:hypothetical protein
VLKSLTPRPIPHAELANNSGWFYTYVYDEISNRFLFEGEVTSPVGNNSYFGSSVSIIGDSIGVGASGYRK